MGHFEWTKERDERLLTLFNCGIHLAEIGSFLGCSSSAISRRVAALKLKRNHNVKTSEFWTQEHDELLRSLVEKNWSSSNISRQMGITEWAVRVRRQALGIPSKQQPRQHAEKSPKKPDPDFEGDTQKWDFICQDKRFQKALFREISSGTENCIPGIVRTPGTENPRRIQPQ